MKRVAVIDYGIGNVRSVMNACTRQGIEVTRVTTGDELASADPSHILLPGVGAIAAAMERLGQRGFRPVLERLVLGEGRHFLGICVGMQILAETCEEFGTHAGLGWVRGRVTRLGAIMPALRVPHVGWNTLHVRDAGDPVLGPLDGADVYFVHSYAFEAEPSAIAATTDYGGAFASAIRKGPILGVQFHPEKSSKAGAGLIARFVGAA
jgi:glutamine amidotransferase